MKIPHRLFRRDRERPALEPVAPSVAPTTPTIDVDAILARSIVLVPFHSYIEPDVDVCLKQLDRLRPGLVKTFKGSSAIDLTRCLCASKALADGFDQLLFVDADVMFDPVDAVRLLCLSDPVVAGVYASKKMGNGRLNVHFDPAIGKVHFGPKADRLYPALKVGAGFLRIKTDVLDRMRAQLQLPLCRMAEDYGWPFFMPFHGPEGGEQRYYAEDYAFCKRLEACGIPLMIDTSFRLYHIGGYAYGWEEARGFFVPRERDVDLDFEERPVPCPTSNEAS